MTCTRWVTLLLLSSTASCVMVIVEFKSVILVLSAGNNINNAIQRAEE